MLKLACTSDLHGHMPKPPASDIYIIAGDICPDYDVDDQIKWLRRSFFPYLEYCVKNYAKHVVFIAGNHDFCFQEAYDRVWEEFIPYQRHNIFYLRDSGLIVEGIKLWGTPWVPNLKSWAFSYDDRTPELEARFALIPRGVDILVSHGPPYNCGDRVPPRTFDEEKWPEALHVGSHSLQNAILDKQPKVVICGHIHCDHGLYKLGNTDIYNVAYLDNSYHPFYNIERLQYERYGVEDRI